jgi:hypothetical protein
MYNRGETQVMNSNLHYLTTLYPQSIDFTITNDRKATHSLNFFHSNSNAVPHFNPYTTTYSIFQPLPSLDNNLPVNSKYYYPWDSFSAPIKNSAPSAAPRDPPVPQFRNENEDPYARNIMPPKSVPRAHSKQQTSHNIATQHGHFKQQSTSTFDDEGTTHEEVFDEAFNQQQHQQQMLLLDPVYKNIFKQLKDKQKVT